MNIEERKQLAKLIGSQTCPRMRIFRIEDSLITEGEGKIFGRWEKGYLLQVNAHNAIKLSELMQQSGHLVAEFEIDDPHVLISCPENQKHDDNTVFAILVE